MKKPEPWPVRMLRPREDDRAPGVSGWPKRRNTRPEGESLESREVSLPGLPASNLTRTEITAGLTLSTTSAKPTGRARIWACGTQSGRDARFAPANSAATTTAAVPNREATRLAAGGLSSISVETRAGASAMSASLTASGGSASVPSINASIAWNYSYAPHDHGPQCLRGRAVASSCAFAKLCLTLNLKSRTALTPIPGKTAEPALRYPRGVRETLEIQHGNPDRDRLSRPQGQRATACLRDEEHFRVGEAVWPHHRVSRCHQGAKRATSHRRRLRDHDSTLATPRPRS